MDSLIDPKLAAFVEEARALNAAAEEENLFRDVDPGTPEGLEAHRTGLSERPVPEGPSPEEDVRSWRTTSSAPCSNTPRST
jgi:hypothetical protein